jgi:N-acetylmuramoyl-L-alanine amidase
MDFKAKYTITPRYLPAPSKRRSGDAMSPGVRFVVAHDTGNPKSTAAGNVGYFTSSANDMSASAHLFVDDKEIIECVPALTASPEKAWHVRYNVPIDNHMFGLEANDAAIGVEYCYGGNINADEAYRKYIWVIAYICHKFGLNPEKAIVGHFMLDPTRKTDPVSGLAQSRRTYEQLLRDVVAEYHACRGEPPPPAQPVPAETAEKGQATATMRLNIRKGAPSTRADVYQVVDAGTKLDYVATVANGEKINGNADWFKDANGNYFWNGGTDKADPMAKQP